MAVGDMFLKIDGLEGESPDAAHKNEIQVDSFNFGAVNTGSGGTNLGSGTGKVKVHDIHFSKQIDKATPNLFINCCSGKHIPTAVLTVRKAGEDPQDYFTITLTDVLISSHSVCGHGSGSLPSDSFSLNFAKVKHEYKTQKSDGTLGPAISKTYDVSANKVC
jgi:type VI secretion system secreted protein Hcp